MLAIRVYIFQEFTKVDFVDTTNDIYINGVGLSFLQKGWREL